MVDNSRVKQRNETINNRDLFVNPWVMMLFVTVLINYIKSIGLFLPAEFEGQEYYHITTTTAVFQSLLY